MKRIHGRYSLGWRSEVQSSTGMYLPDSEKWSGCPKDQPRNQAPGDSFDGLQFKLHKLCGNSSQRTPSSSCYNKALLYWYWQWKHSQGPYSHILKRGTMGVIRSSKRQAATTRSKQYIEPDLQRLRELVADLSFSKIIVILEILEKQHQETGP